MTARPLVLLALGAAAGASVAVLGLVAPHRRAPTVPADAAALVNGVPISRATYQAALAAVADDRRDGAADPALRARVLDRLIEEELLVQRGLALGLVRLDPRVRADLVAAVLAEIDGAAELGPPPDDAALAALHAAEPGRFSRAPRVTVTTAWFAGVDGAARAAAGRATVTDEVSWAAVRAGADRPAVVVPTGAVPAGGLLDVLGPTAARAALTLAVGEVSAPVVTSGGCWLVRLEARADGGVRALAEVRPEVQAEYWRQAGDRRLRATLDDERRAARVVIAPDVARGDGVAAAPAAVAAGDTDEVPR
ncbi:MAG: peptidyl-prolyl cis-trans isomerase [Myxococcales bacterium]|nr:peptidyl-prolyl cis-trans isomerase [Myxococcales bacterium]